MGSYEWPCPDCGQTQKVRAPNGSEVEKRRCAACEEKAQGDLDKAQREEALRTRNLEEAESKKGSKAKH